MKKVVRSLWFGFIGFIVLIVLVIFAMWNGLLGTMPDIEDLQNPIDKYASQVFTADGKLMGTWNKEGGNRIYVDYSQLPKDLVNGLIATEDERFYEHSGIDFIALSRAIVKRVAMGQKSAGGGSTITQQLAKQLFSGQSPNSFQRALRKPFEWIIALKLEHCYTKEEIITMYLNYFDFLHNANGIKNAAKVYFSKEPIELSTVECATLVGMCKNPAYFNPLRYNERTRERRNVVLQQMEKNGYITHAEYSTLAAKPLLLTYHKVDHREGICTYLREYLRQIMMAEKPNIQDYPDWNKDKYYQDSLAWEQDELYGWCNKNINSQGEHYNIYTDGLKVYTTIDSRMQKYAEDACYEHVAKYLQPAFTASKKNTPRFPYTSNITQKQFDAIMRKAMRLSERYRIQKSAGMSEEDIFKTFHVKVPMTVFSYKGEVETMMTPYDSILYYKQFLRTGFMSMEPATGAVKAYVGGLDFEHFSYDMAMEGRRQVGSTMKPFLYSLAMENGYTPCDIVPSLHKTYIVGGVPWTPKGGRGGMISIKSALAHSDNAVSAFLMNKLNPHQLVNLLRKVGIRNKRIDPVLSLCLGPCDVSVGEMVSGYTMFANHGVRVAPLFVTKIVDSNGNVVAQFKPDVSEVISEGSSYRMLELLKAVVNEGTGRRIHGYVNCEMGGKTGTTNSHSDAWFMGVTPELICGAWVGGEDRDIHFNSMAFGQGSAAALPIVGKYLNKVYKDTALPYDKDRRFNVPKDFDSCDKKKKKETDELGIDEIYE